MSGKTSALTILLLLATDATAGVIRGRIRAPRELAVRQGGTEVAPGRIEDAVVWVDSLPPRTFKRLEGPSRATRVEQRGRRFQPLVTAVSAGSPVRFVNRDAVYHNVFSVSPVKKFDLGKYAPKAVNQVTFDTPGIVNLYCDIHPGMAAYVVVLPHRGFARPTRTGQFALPDLPPGTYELRVWHPSLGELNRRVTVPKGRGLDVSLSF